MTGIDLNGLVGGSVGTLFLGALIWTAKLVADRFIPSRTDKRGDVAQAFDVLKEISSILRAEKKEDSDRLKEKQKRIDELESEAEKDYNLIRELREEVSTLQQRLATKESHIIQLTEQIQRLGERVVDGDLEPAAA